MRYPKNDNCFRYCLELEGNNITSLKLKVLELFRETKLWKNEIFKYFVSKLVYYFNGQCPLK